VSPADLAVVALAIALGAVQVDAFDAPLHVRFGEIILTEHRLPAHEDVGLSGSLSSPLQTSWLSQVFMASLYRVGGSPALSLWVMATGGITALLLLACLARLGLGPGARGVISILGMLIISMRLLARPDVLSILLLTLLAWTLLRALTSRRPAGWLATVPVLACLWINSHGLWPVLLPVLAAALLLVRPRRLALGVGLVTLAALCLHPQGLRAAGALLEILSNPEGEAVGPSLRRILEFRWLYSDVLPRSLALDLARWCLPGTLILVLLALVVGRRRAWHRENVVVLVVLLVTSVLALRWSRGVALGGVGQVLGLGLAWQLLAGGKPVPGWLRRGGSLLVVVLAALLLVATLTGETHRRYGQDRARGLGWNEGVLPVEAARRARELAPRGRFLTDYSGGGTVALETAPGGRILIHSLTVYYDLSVYEDYAALVGGRLSLEAVADRYQLTHAVIRHGSREVGGLVRALAASPDWHLVHLDPTGAVFELGPGEDLPPPAIAGQAQPRDLVGLGDFYLRAGDPAVARWYLETAAVTGTTSVNALNNLGVLLLQAGDLQLARMWLDRGCQLGPRFAPLRFNRGLVRQRQGDTAGALADYLEAIRLDGGQASYHLAAGRLLASTGDPGRARHHLQRVVELAPGSTMAREAEKRLAALRSGGR
jgi:hypothetical protein